MHVLYQLLLLQYHGNTEIPHILIHGFHSDCLVDSEQNLQNAKTFQVANKIRKTTRWFRSAVVRNNTRNVNNHRMYFKNHHLRSRPPCFFFFCFLGGRFLDVNIFPRQSLQQKRVRMDEMAYCTVLSAWDRAGNWQQAL